MEDVYLWIEYIFMPSIKSSITVRPDSDQFMNDFRPVGSHPARMTIRFQNLKPNYQFQNFTGETMPLYIKNSDNVSPTSKRQKDEWMNDVTETPKISVSSYPLSLFLD